MLHLKTKDLLKKSSLAITKNRLKVLSFLLNSSVSNHVMFGGYKYGDNLGLQVFSVPLVIGLNWFILVFGTRGVVNYFFDKKYLQIILSSILMVLLDFLIEPVAIEFGWWSWDIVSVPLQNYIMWFLVSLIMQFVISSNNNEISKSISFSLLLSQIIFFIYLNIVII